MSGVIVGVLITDIAENALNRLDIPAFYQCIVHGLREGSEQSRLGDRRSWARISKGEPALAGQIPRA